MERHRKHGDRKDGRLIRTLSPIARVAVFIMPKRVGAQNLIRYTIDMEKVEEYIKKKRQEGLSGFGVLHVLLGAYCRTVSQRPAINRFVNGHRIYQRGHVEVNMVVKPQMTAESEETTIKVKLAPNSTSDEIFNAFNKVVLENKDNGDGREENGIDKTARILNYIPRPILRFVVLILRLLDYYGLLPSALLNVSIFHGSLVITSMGSLGIPPIFHHLYNFGNAPVFISYGAKYKKYVLDSEGNIQQKKFLDFTVSTDERICDGFYFASALKYFQSVIDNPMQLDNPPEKVVEDID